eukprot:197636-Amorphochlora_amoeboformis.AAC.1
MVIIPTSIPTRSLNSRINLPDRAFRSSELIFEQNRLGESEWRGREGRDSGRKRSGGGGGKREGSAGSLVSDESDHSFIL